MGLSINTTPYAGGAQTFPINFALGFLNRADVQVYVEGELDGGGDIIFRAFTWNSDAEILVTDPITINDNVVVQRTVSKTSLVVDFNVEGTATRRNIDFGLKQAMMGIHEFIDGRITALEDIYPMVQYITDMQAILVLNQATQTASEAAQAAAENAVPLYLGGQASDPTLDLLGNALVEGAIYYNTGTNILRSYNGTVWADITALTPGNITVTGDLAVEGTLNSDSHVTAGTTASGSGTARFGDTDFDAHLTPNKPQLTAVSSFSAGHSWNPFVSTQMMVVRNGDCALDIVANTATSSILRFSTQTDEDAMHIDADHSASSMIFRIGGTAEMTMGVNGVTVHGAIGGSTLSGAWIATLGEAQAGTATNKVVTPERVADAITALGTPPIVWANVDTITGAAAITAHNGVSGIADNGTGVFTLTFAVAFADVDYNVQATTLGFLTGNGTLHCVVKGDRTTGPAVKTTTTVQMQVNGSSSGTEYDCLEIYVEANR